LTCSVPGTSIGSSATVGLDVFLTEFDALAFSAVASFPITDDGAGVAIVVFVLFEEVDAVADSVLLPGISVSVVEFDEAVSFVVLIYNEESSVDLTYKKFMSLFLSASFSVKEVFR
jgi:hypothetical protein